MGLGSYFLDYDKLEIINKEDDLIEFATVFVLLICSPFSFILSIKFTGNRARVLIHRLLALCFFLMAGEELSWGQRLFHLDTIEFIRNVNVQGENNIHNLYGYIADHIFILGIFTFGFLVPVFAWLFPFCRKLFDFIGLPVASMGLAIGFLIISSLHDWSVYRILPPLPNLGIAEIRELLSVVALGVLMYESWLLTS